MRSARVPKIAICGPASSGKDTVAAWFAAHTILRLGRSTSEVIAPLVADRFGQVVEEDYANRHLNRLFWLNLGDKLRLGDPAILVREGLRFGDVTTGLRRAEEVHSTRVEGLVDLVLWVERDVPFDPTMKFGAELCDVVVENRGRLGDLYAKLKALARFAGIERTN